MLHADGQYAPEYVANLLNPLLRGEADMVFGSRMSQKMSAIKGGMPFYKFIGNKVLTAIQNKLSKMSLSEFHSGYRAYSCGVLSKLPFMLNSDRWHFDSEIIFEHHAFNYRIAEVPIPTYYGDEICYVNGWSYALKCIAVSFGYWLVKHRLLNNVKFEPKRWQEYPYENKLNDPYSSQSYLVNNVLKLERVQRVLDAGSGNGFLANELAKNGMNVVAVEKKHTQLNQTHLSQIEYLEGDIEKVDFNTLGKFDVVIAGDVIDHLIDPANFIERCRNILNTNGRLILSVPNVAHWSVRLNLVFGRFPRRDRGILDKTHLHFYTQESIKNLLKEKGFGIKKLEVTPIPLPLISPLFEKNHILFLFHRINFWITSLFKDLLGYQLLLECKIEGN